MLLESTLTLLAASSAIASLAIAKRASERRLRKVLRRLGEEQGLVALERVERGGLKFDLAWKEEATGRLTHVFIIGGVRASKAFASLKRAYELWGAKGFYIANGKRSREVLRLIKESPEVNGHVWALTKDSVKELVKLRSKYGRLLDELKPTPGVANASKIGSVFREQRVHGSYLSTAAS
ncbi:MAG: hypothetical protein N3H31_02140 [Candidatus Nezhaarchaeota archaeon]|nr:hypothetical protein [Candidatus Nezhaarchaeota archaeon]